MTNGKVTSRTPPRGSTEAPPATQDSETPPVPSNVLEEEAREQELEQQAPPPSQDFEYSHPLLQGRSPEEVEKLFKMQENAMREQGAQLTGLVSEVRDLKSSMTQPPAPAEPEVTAQEYFQNPVKAIRSELDKQIQPLRQEISEAKSMATAPLVRDKLAAEFGDWAAVEPYVDMLIAREQFPDPNNEGLLRTLYFTAKGLMAHQGVQPTPQPAPVPGQPAPAPGQPAPQPMVPPQHRASSPPPPPPPAPTQPQLRDLTENEKRLAREYGMTAEEYIAWQDTDMDEVAESEIGIPEEKTNA
jgi:hypothetical protein